MDIANNPIEDFIVRELLTLRAAERRLSKTLSSINHGSRINADVKLASHEMNELNERVNRLESMLNGLESNRHPFVAVREFPSQVLDCA